MERAQHPPRHVRVSATIFIVIWIAGAAFAILYQDEKHQWIWALIFIPLALWRCLVWVRAIVLGRYPSWREGLIPWRLR